MPSISICLCDVTECSNPTYGELIDLLTKFEGQPDAKIFFLKDAAIEFLKFTGKDSESKLEREIFTKLQDSIELAHLKADSLMYYHVYGDVYMLSKSNDLGLSVLSMNQHYLELQIFLSEVESNPNIVRT